MSATGTPKVTVAVASDNLQRVIPVSDGVPGLVLTATGSKIGVITKVYSLQDAITKGYTQQAQPFIYSALAQFYNEIGGSFELYLYGVEDTMTLTQMCTVTNANGIKKLLLYAQGKITDVAIARKPASGYNPGTEFLDVDSKTALTTLLALGQYQQSINRPVRVIIEGRINDLAEEPFEPKTANNGFGGILIGDDKVGGSAAVALALARACKYPAHVKIGNGQNGPLSITQAYIGSKKIEDFYPEELDAFSDAGYMILHTREGAAGYYFGVDRMGSQNDFGILAYGRIIDKAHRIVTATTTPFLETSLRINADGTINAADAKYIEKVIEAQLLANLAGQVSGVSVDIPLNQNVVSTSTLQINGAVQPLGYNTWITFNLGLTKTL